MDSLLSHPYLNQPGSRTQPHASHYVPISSTIVWNAQVGLYVATSPFCSCWTLCTLLIFGDNVFCALKHVSFV